MSKCLVCDHEMTIRYGSIRDGFTSECKDHGCVTQQVQTLRNQIAELERTVDELRGELAQSDRVADKARIAELEVVSKGYKEALERIVRTLDRPMLKDDMCLNQGLAVKIAKKALEASK